MLQLKCTMRYATDGYCYCALCPMVFLWEDMMSAFMKTIGSGGSSQPREMNHA